MTDSKTRLVEPRQALYHPPLRFDVLHLPLLGPLLRWRWSRLVFQLALLAVAALIVYDGFSGPQLAPANSATVLAWVHYRGLVILALLLVGNLFCFACPFTLPRTLARKLSISGRRLPSALRNKWVSIAALMSIFWLYEWLDLWASPLLTAWVALAYFLVAFTLEAIFTESPFCKYVCPLGAFNFVYSTASPLQIRAVEASVCRSCKGKECINGSETVLGCGTELFVPTLRSNMDCVFCLDCARACPYDNVALAPRSPLTEASERRWPARWDLAFLIVSLTFMGLLNAFGMVPPVYTLLDKMRAALGLHSDAWPLLLTYVFGTLLLPSVVLFGSGWLSARLGLQRGRGAARRFAARYAPAFVPMGFGIWLAHYGFHFAIGGLTIVPVLQSLALDHGIGQFGAQPNWELSYLLPADWILPFQVFAVLLGFAAALYSLGRRALKRDVEPARALLEILPWALALTLITIASLSIFNLPMEMRGTSQMGNR